MIVKGSNLNLSAQHTQSKQSYEQERLEVYLADSEGQAIAMQVSQQDKLTLSEEAKQISAKVERGDQELSETLQTTVAGNDFSALQMNVGTQSDVFDINNPPPLDPQTRAMKSVIEAIIGHEIAIGNGQTLVARQTTGNTEPLQPGGGLGMRYDAYSYYEESEALQFAAEGEITLADGRQISINFEMQMARQYVSSSEVHIQAGAQLKDPLVLNFSGEPLQLTDEKYDFDLDADGEMDQISFATSGSGMLALDRNGNARIDNGRELFGAQTGNGFAELARYDEDGNGFIDEGDSIYAKLRLWVKGPEGQDQFYSLQDKGVGAIYLGAIDTEFSFKNADNQLQGQLRSSSIYLSENGSVGSVQQVDLVV